MRKTWLLVVVISLLVSLMGPMATASATASAAAAAAPTAGYSAGTVFTTDPDDPDSEATSFQTTDKMVVAWFYGKATEGSPAQDFTVDIEFYTPGGVEYKSTWYDDDTMTLSDTITEDSVARKYIQVAGTDAADNPGQWSVKFYVEGKLFKIEGFSLVGAKTGGTTDATVTDVKAYLEAQGYKVYFAEEGQFSSGDAYAYTRMDMAADDLYSSEVSNQIYHAFYALRVVYPDVPTLVCGLMAGKYEVVFFANSSDWDDFYAGGSWEEFVNTLQYGIWDRETGEPLSSSESKNFMTKNFGAGTQWAAPNVTPGKGNPNTGLVSSVKVEVLPAQLAADGKSVADVTVMVYDKDNQPLSDTEVEFTLSGSAAPGCRIRPTVTATDSNGKAQAILTAGTTNGTVNVTAKVKSTTGVAIVTLGTGQGTSTDPKADDVIAALTQYGYKVHEVGYFTDDKGNKTDNVGVAMDMASRTFDDIVGQQMVLGWLVLYQTYPDANGLFVILYYDRYSLILGTTRTDLETVLQSADDQQVVQAFWSKVFGGLIIIDRTTGERVTDTQGFIQKNFTQGGSSGSGGGFDLAPSTGAGPWSAMPRGLATRPLTAF
ncbi:MAG: Ig-like domain-containing protein [Chloroflexi bacterium]|nr:Ig-like domain-containing protein [Chloroflexota bacterium]MBU1747282.1 Ig-like domain-containing protein [Chloroflexota bacterium]MBU1879071.1 Ig-like domain-containing protein [Chloroflexota bacterium]